MVNYLRRDVETAAASVRETAEEPRTDRPRYQVSISRSPNFVDGAAQFVFAH